MEKLLLILFLFIATNGLAQPGDTIKNNPVKNQLISGDSNSIKLPASDSFMRNEDMERNVANLLSLQKSIQKRETKEKRNALTRIGIGIALLIILIIGLRRKTTKK